MKAAAFLTSAAIVIGGCTTSSTKPSADPRGLSTLHLCRTLATHTDQDYRRQVAELLVRRGATVEKCQRLISSDNSIAASIAVTGAAVAVGVAAAQGGGGGGYYPGAGSYGVAWDQFYNEHYMLTWRCRDKTTGRFVDDSYCGGKLMVDNTWPGWSA